MVRPMHLGGFRAKAGGMRVATTRAKPPVNKYMLMTENPRTVLESTNLRKAIEVLQTLEVRHLRVVTES